MSRISQLEMFQKGNRAYGGSLMTKRKGRLGPRPISARASMHLVLRSTKATGDWSFRRPKNAVAIAQICARFAARHGVKIHSLANVGNHLHFHVRLSSRHSYRAFIRAITAAIAMKVTGASRWRRLKSSAPGRFWDRRPFTRIVSNQQDFLGLEDYVRVNQLEGDGFRRHEARLILAAKDFGRRLWRTGIFSGPNRGPGHWVHLEGDA